jgi:hypothetical protein
MANQSSTRMKLETSIKNELGLEFDIDQSTTCKMSADTSQLMAGINIRGSKDVALKQVQDLQSLCYATQVADLDVFAQLSATAQNDILKSLNQEGGLPGANLSSTNVDVLNEIENKVDLAAKLKATKDCLAQVQAPQVMEDINIEEAMNINLSQESATFNKCVLDSAVDVAQKNGVELDSVTKVTEDVTQKGWDPLASLGGMIGSTAMLAIVPLIASFFVAAMVVMIGSDSLAPGGTGNPGESFNHPPLPGIPGIVPGQTGGAISKFLGVRSRKGKALINLLVKLILVAGVAWLLFKMFGGGKHHSTPSVHEGYHSIPHRGFQAQPLALRHQYHHPHVSEDLFPSHRTHPDLIPQNEVPSYVKRWH